MRSNNIFKEKTMHCHFRKLILSLLIGSILSIGILQPSSAQKEKPCAPGTYTTLPFALSPECSATGINAAGDVIGNYGDPSSHGFLLRNGTVTVLDYPGALETVVFGINSAGDIVGDRLDP